MLLVLVTTGCGESDPGQKILDERARWDVRVLNWAQEPGGPINISTRVSGPPTSKIGRFTVRFDLLDADEQKLGEHWHVFDLAQVPRGGPSDLLVRIPDPGWPVENLALNLMLEPTAAERGRLDELRPGAE
jgi:hypothetical protein